MTWHNQEVLLSSRHIMSHCCEPHTILLRPSPPHPPPSLVLSLGLAQGHPPTSPPISFAYPPEGRRACFARPNSVHSKSSTTHQSQTISQSNCITTSSSSGPHLAYLALTRIPTHINHPQGHILHIWAHIHWWHLDLAPAPVAAPIPHQLFVLAGTIGACPYLLALPYPNQGHPPISIISKATYRISGHLSAVGILIWPKCPTPTRVHRQWKVVVLVGGEQCQSLVPFPLN